MKNRQGKGKSTRGSTRTTINFILEMGENSVYLVCWVCNWEDECPKLSVGELMSQAVGCIIGVV